jgi:hypothetical protein
MSKGKKSADADAGAAADSGTVAVRLGTIRVPDGAAKALGLKRRGGEIASYLKGILEGHLNELADKYEADTREERIAAVKAEFEKNREALAKLGVEV